MFELPSVVRPEAKWVPSQASSDCRLNRYSPRTREPRYPPGLADALQQVGHRSRNVEGWLNADGQRHRVTRSAASLPALGHPRDSASVAEASSTSNRCITTIPGMDWSVLIPRKNHPREGFVPCVANAVGPGRSGTEASWVSREAFAWSTRQSAPQNSLDATSVDSKSRPLGYPRTVLGRAAEQSQPRAGSLIHDRPSRSALQATPDRDRYIGKSVRRWHGVGVAGRGES